jgi:hypothetical protein
VKYQRSHIDLMPLGDLQTTFLNLLIGYPKVHWIFNYQVDEKRFTLDDQPIKEILADVPLSEPSVINYLKEEISAGIKEVVQENQ